MMGAAATVAVLIASTAATAKEPRSGMTKRTTATEKEARAFFWTSGKSASIVPVAAVDADIGWSAATDVTPEHTGARTGADKALAALAGSKLIIERCKTLLGHEKDLDQGTARQLHKLLLGAAEAPGTIPEVVAKRVEAEAHQSAIQDGYTFCLQPKPGGGCARIATANDIDNILLKSRDLGERQRVWTASKEIGRPLKPGLADLQSCAIRSHERWGTRRSSPCRSPTTA